MPEFRADLHDRAGGDLRRTGMWRTLPNVCQIASAACTVAGPACHSVTSAPASSLSPTRFRRSVRTQRDNLHSCGRLPDHQRRELSVASGQACRSSLARPQQSLACGGFPGHPASRRNRDLVVKCEAQAFFSTPPACQTRFEFCPPSRVARLPAGVTGAIIDALTRLALSARRDNSINQIVCPRSTE